MNFSCAVAVAERLGTLEARAVFVRLFSMRPLVAANPVGAIWLAVRDAAFVPELTRTLRWAAAVGVRRCPRLCWWDRGVYAGLGPEAFRLTAPFWSPRFSTSYISVAVFTLEDMARREDVESLRVATEFVVARMPRTISSVSVHAFEIAVSRRHMGMLRVLAGRVPICYRGWALVQAAHGGHADVAALLVPLWLPKDDFEYARRVAAEKGHDDIVEILARARKIQVA